jgi:quercetin dioxygenase-like cupin family protein
MNAGILRRGLRLLSLALAVGISGAALAHETGTGESHRMVMKQAIPEAAGKNVLVVEVGYAPGQSSEAHMHPGSIFAYVLEGSVVSQLEGQPPRTYTQGEGWYEPPYAHHLVSRNASDTKPAKLLVWAITGAHDPIKLPLPGSASRSAELPKVASH